MRGKAPFSKSKPTFTGITPAYAGKSIGTHSAATTTQDHPRLCGEKAGVPFLIAISIGSPPPMRGKDLFFQILNVRNRITPAYAGKSCLYQHEAVILWDHPRLCGEKTILQVFTIPHMGSPPPMRGKEMPSRRQFCSHRITPAYAGKRNLLMTYSRQIKDHPRLCGEKHILMSYLCGIPGSPPPMRGKVTLACSTFDLRGITPAYAGKRTGTRNLIAAFRDHPRLCGEKQTSICL